MHVERGKRRPARDHAGDARDPRQEIGQFRLYFDHHLGAHFRQGRRIAHELDGVAETLLGVQQDSLARKRIFTEPQRLAEAAAARRHPGPLPAPFVGRKAAAVVAQPAAVHRGDRGPADARLHADR